MEHVKELIDLGKEAGGVLQQIANKVLDDVKNGPVAQL